MGIDKVSLEALLIAQTLRKRSSKALMLGRQCIYAHAMESIPILMKYTGVPAGSASTVLYERYAEPLFKFLSYTTIDSLDYSDYEGATLIHDLNIPLPPNSMKYDFVFDGGTIEHIFNVAQVLENIVNLVEVGGIFLSVTMNNNYSGHGIYQFSPEFFLSTMRPQYGMQILRLYLAKMGSSFEEWIDITEKIKKMSGTIYTPFGAAETYLVCIAEKVSEARDSFLTVPPQQYSYENEFWIKSTDGSTI